LLGEHENGCSDVAIGGIVKRIEAIIQPERLEHVMEALRKTEIQRLTTHEVGGFARQGGQDEMYRGSEYGVNLLPKVMIILYVNDQHLEYALELIISAARTGEEGRVGDGKIAVTDLYDVVRIRTGERGPEAI
jgi:nitrogen regulatory protein P-II 2